MTCVQLLAACVAVSSGCASFVPVSVIVCNNTDQEIKNISIEYRGGQINAENAESGKSTDVAIAVGGESGIDVSFESKGRMMTYVADVYVEPAYCGYVAFLVGDTVTVKDGTVAQGPLFYDRVLCALAAETDRAKICSSVGSAVAQKK